MGKLRCLVLLSILVLPVCSSNFSYYIDIRPKANNDIYEMAKDSSVTFQVEGFQIDGHTDEVLPLVIERAWWNFSKDVLIKTGSDKSTITLRAVNTGTSELSVSIISFPQV